LSVDETTITNLFGLVCYQEHVVEQEQVSVVFGLVSRRHSSFAFSNQNTIVLHQVEVFPFFLLIKAVSAADRATRNRTYILAEGKVL